MTYFEGLQKGGEYPGLQKMVLTCKKIIYFHERWVVDCREGEIDNFMFSPA